jgi:hypothetical protein
MQWYNGTTVQRYNGTKVKGSGEEDPFLKVKEIGL